MGRCETRGKDEWMLSYTHGGVAMRPPRSSLLLVSPYPCMPESPTDEVNAKTITQASDTGRKNGKYDGVEGSIR